MDLVFCIETILIFWSGFYMTSDAYKIMMINININLASNTLLPVQSQGATNNI